MNEPNNAAIEAAWLKHEQKAMALWYRGNAIYPHEATFKAGYESAKAANDLALQLAYESGKEAAEGNGWVKCEDRLPSESGLYDVTIVTRWEGDFGDNRFDISVRHNVFFHTNMLPKLLPRETIVAWKNRDEPYTGE